MTYTPLSPDGFHLTHECKSYPTYTGAQRAIKRWAKNYSAQGYYSQTCYNGYIRHIPVPEIPDYCQIIEN